MNKPIIRKISCERGFVIRHATQHYRGIPLIAMGWSNTIKLSPEMEQKTSYKATISAYERDKLDYHLNKIFELQFGKNRIE